MRLVIERAELLSAVEPAARVIQRRNLIPILNNIRLVAEGSLLAVTATDLDIEIRTSAPASIDEPGAATVPAATLHDLVKSLREGQQIEISQGEDKTRLTVKAGRSQTRVPTLPADEYPNLVADDLTHSFTINGSALSVLLRDTAFAACTEASFHHICGVHLHEAMQEGGSRMATAATDGSRLLARRHGALPHGASAMPAITIPSKTVGEIVRLLDKSKGEAFVELSASKIRVTFGRTVLTSSLIEGTFPDYQSIIQQDAAHSITVEAEALAAAINRIAITADTANSRATALSFTDRLLTLSIANAASGEAREEVECDFEGDPFAIGFDHRLLSRVIGALGGDTVFMKFPAKGNAQFMTREGSELLALIAPMQV